MATKSGMPLVSKAVVFRVLRQFGNLAGANSSLLKLLLAASRITPPTLYSVMSCQMSEPGLASATHKGHQK